MKPCIIKQPAGIGDVFFCQKIARVMLSKGYEVIWPLRPDITWIGDYIKDIHFPSLNDVFPGKEIFDTAAGFVIEENGAFISLATANFTHNDGGNMTSKYSMLDIDVSDWADYFKYNRNIEKENELYYNVLGLTDDSEYVYINAFYNTDNYQSNIFVNEKYDYPVIENKIIDGYSLFDWCKVLENAKEIHTTPTSVCYLIETIDTKAKLVYTCREECQYLEHLPLFKKKILWKLVNGEKV